MQPALSPAMPAATGGDGLAPAPRSPTVRAPARSPASIRRTSTIDVSWPDGQGRQMLVDARARDLLTVANGDGVVLAERRYTATLDPDRRIRTIASVADGIALDALAGTRAGGGLRAAIATALPGLREAADPLYLILDDLAGASLVAPWAWSQWDAGWSATIVRMKTDPATSTRFDKENICAGMRTGSSGLSFASQGTPAGDLRDPGDPSGWHDLPDGDGPRFRRARRIDVVDDADGACTRIDSHFQDSASTPDGGRAVVHEYDLRATADPVADRLAGLEAEARVLPFPECLAAAPNIARLTGGRLQDLRATVLTELRGTAGCTHLNDALRALAETPAMLAAVRHVREH